ncbi:hypothetical protein HDV05_006769, partial [Chytridiales sp. JEL 0842]
MTPPPSNEELLDGLQQTNNATTANELKVGAASPASLPDSDSATIDTFMDFEPLASSASLDKDATIQDTKGDAGCTIDQEALSPQEPADIAHTHIPEALLPFVVSPEKDGELTKSSSQVTLVNSETARQQPIIDPRDLNTPDEWISRHPDLVRLTGRHPFNCEPPLPLLMDHGWITPVPLHYVRNHGAVPNLEWNKHTLRVDGFVKNPKTFTMDMLLSLPTTTLPILLVCAGNRRKEQNMIKQTIGFSWGPAGLSNSFWTGVLLKDLIDACGGLLSDEECMAKHGKLPGYVTFEGADTLPKGMYGTSVQLRKAMDPQNDILIAFAQNGELLTPDHGFPVRVVIPGFIGGRMVKWLNRVTVAEAETESVYHYMDNRVLPTPVKDAQIADAEGWWYHPSFIINELNINSAISSPAHNETVASVPILSIPLSPPLLPKTPYTFKGYAYTGGGRKITRVELSFNRGQSWMHAHIHTYPTEQFSYPPHSSVQQGEVGPRHGRTKYWCWWFWEVEVEDVWEVLRVHAVKKGNQADGMWKWRMGCREICVRAWDEALNTQPEKPTWNLMGMMNNPTFKVRPHLQVQPGQSLDALPAISLRFEHPTIPNGNEGWMKQGGEGWEVGPDDTYDDHEEDESVEDVAKLAQPAAPVVESKQVSEENSSLPLLTLEEVSKHSTEEDCWIVVRGLVYDCTPFMAEHPGGAGSIVLVGGTDCTEEFDAIHSQKAQDMLEKYLIGRIGPPSSSSPATTSSQTNNTIDPQKPSGLNPKSYTHLPLIHKTILTPSTRLLRFALPPVQSGTPLPQNMTPGHHLLLKLSTPPTSSEEAGVVVRAYTPTLFSWQLGYFELLIRVYDAPGGRASRALDALRLGGWVGVRGPVGEVGYQGLGVLKVPKGKGEVVGRVGEFLEKVRKVKEGEGNVLSADMMEQVDSLIGSTSLSHLLSTGLSESSSSTYIRATTLNLIAAGTGITPIYQLLCAISTEWSTYHQLPKSESPDILQTLQPPTVSLVYANRNAAEVLLGKELRDLMELGGSWLNVTHVLSQHQKGLD